MKTSIYLTALLFTCLLFVSASCNKGNMTDEDKDWNVLEWRVDGEKYKATCSTGTIISGCDPVDCQYYHDTKTLYIIGGSEGSGIEIYKYRDLSINNNIQLNNYDFMIYIHSPNESGCKEYNIDTTSTYNLEIEPIDTINKIITGYFSFTGINDCQDTIGISDGYFKLSYRP